MLHSSTASIACCSEGQVWLQAFFESQGLTYTADGIIGNTFNSHRLVVYAGKQSLAKQWEVMSLLFKAFFVDVSSLLPTLPLKFPSFYHCEQGENRVNHVQSVSGVGRYEAISKLLLHNSRTTCTKML